MTIQETLLTVALSATLLGCATTGPDGDAASSSARMTDALGAEPVIAHLDIGGVT